MAKNSSKNIEGNLVKRAHSTQKFTEKDLEDLAKCSDPITGPHYFLDNFFYIQHPVKGKLKYEAFDYQRRLIDSYHNHRFNINLLPRQTGKALSLDTPIPTPSGWTTMKEICVGDQILSSDGYPTTVTFATEVMHDRECYKVEFDNGESIIADADHLWEINSGYWNIQQKILTTKEILEYKEKNDTVVYIPITSAIKGTSQKLPISPYTLGVWLGDGASDGGCYTQSNIDNIEMVNLIMSDGYILSTPRVNSPNSEVRTIYGLRPTLKENSLLKNKHIPDIYLRASIDQRLDLLRGLMDTDGSVDSRSGRCEFYQKRYSLIKQVRELLSSLGIKSRCNFKTLNGEKYYTLGFATNEYRVFNLKRKANLQEKCKGHPKNKRLYITQIEKIKSVPVRCIQVDNPRHLFLCGETMIPTHNTTTAAGYLLWYAMFVPDSTILIAAHKYTGAQEIMSRIRYAYELCPDIIRAGATSYNKQSIEFENGSRIVAQTTTETTGRGMALSLLYADEFAFVAPNIASEFWTSISPTLATGGKAIITSTPNSDEDQFAQIWKEANYKFDEYGNEQPVGRNGFFPFRAYWNEHPERDEAWAHTERSRIGEERFRREHDCLAHNSLITLKDESGKIFKIPIEEFYNMCRSI